MSADRSQPDAAGLRLTAGGNRETIVGRLETPSLLPLPANPGELGENTEKGIYCPPFFHSSLSAPHLNLRTGNLLSGSPGGKLAL